MGKKIKLTVITWDIYAGMFKVAGECVEGIELDLFSSKSIERSPEVFNKALSSLKEADAVFLYRSTESFWDDIEPEVKKLGKHKSIISVGSNPSYWLLSTVSPEIVGTCFSYLTYGGKENFKNLLRFILHSIFKLNDKPAPPKEIPWEGLYHPDASDIYKNIDEYLHWYNSEKGCFQNKVGLLFSRHYWVNENCQMINALIRKLEEKGLGTIPAFTYSVKDEGLGTKSSAEVIKEYFIDGQGNSRIDALIKLTPLFSGLNSQDGDWQTDIAQRGVTLFKKLNVPVFQPVLTSYKTIKEWEEDPHGLGSLTAWYVTLPEFEGVIEPMMLAAAEEEKSGIRKIVPIEERCKKIAERVFQWIKLKNKPVSKRKVGFILHNNPCASVEATVGGAANLDSIESVAQILKQMKNAGYSVEPPENGKKLIETIMAKKAISEFRWTTVDEIIKKGGCLKLIPVEQYNSWFEGLTSKFKKRITESWGKPPGKEINGVPAAMVYQDKIVVTGVQYGNAVICVQPKRGCAGPKCDGKVCKILHDPDIPPPHQYFATYRYLEYDFKVDCIVHVGTHGNLEFLPGKGVGLSQNCCPDLAIGNIPHLYIYNADNPPEGAIAKRRSYATLIDHMQAVMVRSGVNRELEELERFLGEYYQAKDINKSRAHQLEHLILDRIKKTNLSKEIRYSSQMPFTEVVKRAHEAISLIKNSQMNEGLHIFGNIPEGNQRVEYIRAIFSSDTDNLSLRSSLFELLGIDLSYALKNQGEVYPEWKMSYGQVLAYVDEVSKKFIEEVLNSKNKKGDLIIKELVKEKIKNKSVLKKFSVYEELVKDINKRIEDSREIESLFSGFNACYIPSGPSGKITRGRYDILPTGRNFYTLDIYRLPTKAAYKVGEKLAQELIDKHLREEGRLPENVAIYWTCMDITCCDGEGMAQIMALLGARPVWKPNGRVDGFEIIPLKELKRPRIDVTIRVGGIIRDNFPGCISYIDGVIRKVASLNEPVELNFVKKHALEQLQKKNKSNKKSAWQEVTTRIFGSKPGTYMAGVNLAVYASAWKDEKDLTDIFVYWNQYAYGKDVFGKEQAQDLINNLKTVDITFNKAYTDEYDLFGCCCYFATQGGMTAAARVISGKDVKAYYGDTRDTKNVGVRDLSDEVRRVVRSKLLNPKWIEGMKKHGYKGLGDISKKIGRVYGWEATTGEVDDWIFDDIARTYVLDKEMRKLFEENNPWALEEISRRLLEAYERGLWNANPEVLEGLKNAYLEIESWLEEKMGDVKGDFQAGSVDIFTMDDVKDWQDRMKEIRELIRK